MRTVNIALAVTATLGLVCAAKSASAAPSLRYTADQRGDWVVVGNTLGYDCGGLPLPPLVGAVGACGAAIGDSAPDLYVRSDPAAGAAEIGLAATSANARSTAMLATGNLKAVQIPATAIVTHAQLYWGATLAAGGLPNGAVVVERPGVFTESVAAAQTVTANVNGKLWYQSRADATALVKQRGAGAYSVSGVASLDVRNRDDQEQYAAWSLVVFYYLPSAPVRNLTLFDGLDALDNGSADAAISGFVVPNAGFDATLGVVSYEGDTAFNGDSLLFGRDAATLTALSNPLNPVDNFFNGTRSAFGVPVSQPGDLPQWVGTAGTMSGVDIDVVDVTSSMTANQTSALLRAQSTNDTYALGALMTSISTFMPDFTRSPKSVLNVSRTGAPIPGDVLEYTIQVNNDGSDRSLRSVLSDPLPAGVSLVGGTLEVTNGPNAGRKTDAAGDDQAEYDAGTRTVVFRLGAGADATTGGSLTVGQTTTVKFRVKLDATASGTIANKATILSGGAVAASQGLLRDAAWGTMGPSGQPDTATPVLVGLDTDGDGLPDELEVILGTDPTKADTDGDGLLDGTEVGPDATRPIDTDGDGVIDARDTDDDGDTLLTRDELVMGRTVDTDGDAVPDHLDVDDDNDGVLTKKEVEDSKLPSIGTDVDRDGKPNWLDTDADGDAIPDGREVDDVAPKDGVPDYLQAAKAPSPTPTGCKQDSECPPTSYCVVSSGSCQPRKPNGDGCTSANQCLSARCHTDGLCGLPNGAACTEAASCRSGGCEAGACGPDQNVGGYLEGGGCTVGVGGRTPTSSLALLAMIAGVLGSLARRRRR